MGHQIVPLIPLSHPIYIGFGGSMAKTVAARAINNVYSRRVGAGRVVLAVIWLWEPQILIFGHELFFI